MGSQMKTAFAFLGDRIAPVFDAAQRIHVAELEAGLIVSEAQETLEEQPPIERAMHLVDLGIDTLVCGAISTTLREALITNGIQVFPFVAGNLQEVIQAYLKNELGGDTYKMPGCRLHTRRRGFENQQKEGTMPGRVGKGSGAGGSRGTGQGQGKGQGGGRRNRPVGEVIPGAGSAVGTCLCPKCGHQVPHEPGVPCAQKTCLICGTSMTRG